MPFVSIMTPCYNEEENVAELYRQVRAVMEDLPPAAIRTRTSTSSSTTRRRTERSISFARSARPTST